MSGVVVGGRCEHSQSMRMLIGEAELTSSLKRKAWRRCDMQFYKENIEPIDQVYDGMIAMACNVVRELCDSSWAPKEVLFARARPDDVGSYRRFFRAPRRFDSDQTALRFTADWLAHPIPAGAPEAFRPLREGVQARGRIELVPRLRR